MAISSLGPYLPDIDEVSFEEACLLLRRTGHPVSVQTLRRWCKKHGTVLSRRGRKDYASWTDLLLVHAAEVDRRTRG